RLWITKHVNPQAVPAVRVRTGVSDPLSTLVPMLQSPAPGPREVRAAVDQMRAAAAVVNTAIADGVLIDTADEALPELTADLLAVSDAAQAAATVTLGRTNSSGVLRGRGFVSTKAWVKATTRCGDGDARRLLARSRDLDRAEFAPTR